MIDADNPESLRDLFAKNRTEEIGEDVYEEFVVPPFYDRLNLETARKPRVIEGGRGSGKTMLLRYLSHASTFSQSREAIPVSAIEHVGLYWKADTQFARGMTNRGHKDDTWSAAFEHLIALVLGAEVLESLRGIARSSCPVLTAADLVALDLGELRVYNSELGVSLDEVAKSIRRLTRQFERWVANSERSEPPEFLPGLRFVRAIVETVQDELPKLRSSKFFVYIDEYENLQPYQQRIVNTYLKHSEMPLIVNIAVKRNAMKIAETTGPESLVDIADYRKHNLEDYLAPDFASFAAEILLLQLSRTDGTVPIRLQQLRDPAELSARRDKDYRDEVLQFVRRLLPGRTHEELGALAFADAAIVNVLRERISRHLRRRGSAIDPEQFIRPMHARASITASVLLARPRVTPELVLAELNRLARGEENSFTGSASWIHNNFIGALLPLYEPYGKVCPFYAGFDAYCALAKLNLRHFLELCHRAFSRVTAVDHGAEGELNPVSLVEQAEAAREASAAFLSQVRSFGTRGDQLHAFVLRLGSLFALAHKRPTQSEPEICHFAVARGDRVLDDDQRDFLDEAEKWSVLSREAETKQKQIVHEISFEYVLNPIYSVYFNITFRKRRKLELDVEEFAVLMSGSYDEFASLLKRYSAKWEVVSAELAPSLFSHLEDAEYAE